MSWKRVIKTAKCPCCGQVIQYDLHMPAETISCLDEEESDIALLRTRIKNLEAVNDDLRIGWDKTLDELQELTKDA